MELKDLKVGDEIKLNDKARSWTKDLVFTIDEVASWGVKCRATFGPGVAHYRALWDEIENG